MKYLGYYDVKSNEREKRKHALSATNKMTYIASAIAITGERVEIISASPTEDSCNYRGKTIKVTDNVSEKLFSTFGERSRISKIVNVLLFKYHILMHLLTETRKESPVLVYHSLGYSREVLLAKKVKKFKLILEIEELYGDVIGNDKVKQHELRLANAADAYIFPTTLLDTLINKNGKPAVIIHGTYQVEFDRHCHFNDGRVHVVYAGTFDPRKGGAAAAAAAEFLDERYHVHIIGFGSDGDKKHLLETIDEVSKKTKCHLTYDGCLSGEDYIRFLQSCDIGLSTQNPDAAFNATSFPSKVLSYMVNGLRVVSIRIEAVEHSAVGDLITYYDKQTPEKIASAIMHVDMNAPCDSRTRIYALDRKFTTEISELLKG